MPDVNIRISQALAEKIVDLFNYQIRNHIVTPEDRQTLESFLYYVEEANNTNALRERIAEIHRRSRA